MRDLERAEIAKAALQTEEVDTQLTKMKKEYVAYKGQSQDQMKQLQSALLKGKCTQFDQKGSYTKLHHQS